MRPLILPSLLLAFLVATPAAAVFLDTLLGTENTQAPAPPPMGPGDPGWDNAGLRGSFTGVYLGHHWVLTANHVGSTDMDFGGMIYPKVPGSDIQLTNPDMSLADLRLFRVDPAPNLPMLDIRVTTPTLGMETIMIGQGVNRGSKVTWSSACGDFDGYQWGSGRTLRWGRNHVSDATEVPNAPSFLANTFAFFTDFDETGTDEAHAVHGDSGGPVFVRSESTGKWELAGLLYTTLGFVCGETAQPSDYALYDNLTYAADLSVYRDQILDLTRECRNGVDDDGDGDIDHPADDGCWGPDDPLESFVAPAVSREGLAAIAVVMVGVAVWQLARRRQPPR